MGQHRREALGIRKHGLERQLNAVCFWTAGQDANIAAGAGNFVRANVLSLFGMAWNQSAVHYLSAQGIVMPASVRRFGAVLGLIYARAQRCAAAAARWWATVTSVKPAQRFVRMSAGSQRHVGLETPLEVCCTHSRTVAAAFWGRDRHLRHPVPATRAGGRHCVDAADAAVPLVLHVLQSLGHSRRRILVRIHALVLNPGCNPGQCVHICPQPMKHVCHGAS